MKVHIGINLQIPLAYNYCYTMDMVNNMHDRHGQKQEV